MVLVVLAAAVSANQQTHLEQSRPLALVRFRIGDRDAWAARNTCAGQLACGPIGVGQSHQLILNTVSTLNVGTLLLSVRLGIGIGSWRTRVVVVVLVVAVSIVVLIIAIGTVVVIIIIVLIVRIAVAITRALIGSFVVVIIAVAIAIEVHVNARYIFQGELLVARSCCGSLCVFVCMSVSTIPTTKMERKRDRWYLKPTRSN